MTASQGGSKRGKFAWCPKQQVGGGFFCCTLLPLSYKRSRPSMQSRNLGSGHCYIREEGGFDAFSAQDWVILRGS